MFQTLKTLLIITTEGYELFRNIVDRVRSMNGTLSKKLKRSHSSISRCMDLGGGEEEERVIRVQAKHESTRVATVYDRLPCLNA